MWWALWHTDPWGEQRADLRSAIVASVLANAHRDPKRKPGGFKPADFMPYLPRDQERRVDDAALSKRLLAAFGLKPVKPPKKPARKR